MRFLTIISLLFFSLINSGTKNVAIKPGELNGTWVPVKQEFAGKQVPPAAFQKQKLVVSDSTYTFTAESVDKGVIKYNNGKMDIYGKEGVNAGKHFTAIYKAESGQVTICYNLKGDNYPEAFETKPNTFLFLSVFKKADK